MSDNFNQDYAYYQGVLVLPKDFDEALLKKAYRREAMKWHPDKNPGDAYAEERLKLVNEAYEFFCEVKNFKSQNQSSTGFYKQAPKQKTEYYKQPPIQKREYYKQPPEQKYEDGKKNIIEVIGGFFDVIEAIILPFFIIFCIGLLILRILGL